ncbi:MAG: hypothetical protein AAFY88_24585 [Acidobacteriota bacterium]
MNRFAKTLALCTLSALTLTAALPTLAAGDAFQEAQKASHSGKKLKKTPLLNPRLPDFTSIFNWGLKLKNMKSLYLFAGIAAQRPDLTIVDPMDYVGQTDFILAELDLFLLENNLDRDDIVRIEFTLVEGYTPDEFGAILERFAGYFEDVSVKPAAGTLRVVSALAFPGLVVEYEVWCAK